MKIGWFVLLLVSLYCGVSSTACAEPVYDNGDASTQARVTFDAERAFAYLKKQCEFGPRPPGSPPHKATQHYLFTELQKFANRVSRQAYEFETEGQTLQMNNILAQFGPQRGETLLLAAHWDTRPIADHDPNPENRSKPILGANDGASGVAVLLEIARILKVHPPPRRVFVVLFDGEDYGRTVDTMFIGSRYFAQNMGEWKPDYGILLDMVGDKDLQLPIERFSWQANREFTEAIWQRAAELGLTPFQPRLGAAIMDDHVPLIQAGIPMVNIIDFNYPHWHTLEDTVDKCSAKSLEVVGTLVLSVIYEGL